MAGEAGAAPARAAAAASAAQCRRGLLARACRAHPRPKTATARRLCVQSILRDLGEPLVAPLLVAGAAGTMSIFYKLGGLERSVGGLDGRLDKLEAKLDHGLCKLEAKLDDGLDKLRAEVRADMAALYSALDQRFNAQDQRFDALARKIDGERLYTLGVLGMGGAALYLMLKPR